MRADRLSTGEKKVLKALGDGGRQTPGEIQERGDFEQLVEVMNATSWLRSKGLVTMEEELVETVTLEEEGEEYAENGFPERRILERMAEAGEEGLGIDELEDDLGKKMAGITIGWLKRKGWADINRGEEGPVLNMTERGRSALDERGPDEEVLRFIFEMGEVEKSDIADPDALELLAQRKNVVRVSDEVIRHVELTEKGRGILKEGMEIRDRTTQLTHRMLKDGSWRDADFRPYDVDTYAPVAKGGKLNPVSTVTEEIRQIFLRMGFTEVDYEIIQSCFWNMDALFIPQDHAARDLQDTFYMETPDRMEVDEEDLEAVRKVHEDGGDTGSRGWGYGWSRDEARRVVLRTHTTVNSIRYLAEHPEPPVKIFTVGRVFRNERVTFKHLPEFQQIEGIVMEEGASFRMLLGLMREFYDRMGFEGIRIRPSYFPYTEPSLEVDAKFRGQWMEMGGAGIFRPEVTGPFGIEHPVLAWGLGLERLIMIRYGINDIRKLYMNDLDFLRDAPLL